MILLCFALLSALLTLALSFSLLNPYLIKYRPAVDFEGTLNSSATVSIRQAEWLIFEPRQATKTGFIFYPGTFCDPLAYAPLMKSIAEAGYLAVIIPMPSHMAMFGINKAEAVKAQFNQISNWVIGGHSQGGGAASIFVQQNRDAVNGLILWDAFTIERFSIADRSLPTLSLYGNKHHDPDRLDIVKQNVQYLPIGTKHELIEGADHFQFGAFLDADVAEKNISRVRDTLIHEQIIARTLSFLGSI